MIVIYHVYIKRIIEEKNFQKQQELIFQNNLLEQNIQVQESEREQIAKRVHDDLGSKINILSLLLQNINNENIKQSKEQLTGLVKELSNTSRNISHTLYPVYLERFGLIDSINEVLFNVQNILKLDTHFNVSTCSYFSIEEELNIYRILQEFISNTIKHSESESIIYHFRETNNYIAILIGDSGKGVDEEMFKKKGMGIKNIETRLQYLKANFKWKTKKNSGLKLMYLIQK
ncbi:sensor histidine kinase [Aureivirga sp. CE67]|uniref:sensor histidine kinase n=1 Tax=Aureivirga sp. CE67 TaxID=1788983 RepID=UPI0018CB4FA8|nr:histidine kinase [Aureivirga sp. CE67]